MNEHVKTKLKEIFESTIENGVIYEDSIDHLEYYALFCKAASKDQLFKVFGNNLCMFSCTYEKEDAIMMIFSIPINSQETGAKNIAERVMEVITAIEKCFVTLDHVKSEEVSEDKFVYVSAIKKI